MWVTQPKVWTWQTLSPTKQGFIMVLTEPLNSTNSFLPLPRTNLLLRPMHLPTRPATDWTSQDLKRLKQDWIPRSLMDMQHLWLRLGGYKGLWIVTERWRYWIPKFSWKQSLTVCRKMQKLLKDPWKYLVLAVLWHISCHCKTWINNAQLEFLNSMRFLYSSMNFMSPCHIKRGGEGRESHLCSGRIWKAIRELQN